MTKVTLIDKLLAVLSDNQWHTAQELTYLVSHRFGDTIHKARKLGYDIEKRAIAPNQFQYRCLNTTSTTLKQTTLI
jgi:hypothetical protein